MSSSTRLAPSLPTETHAHIVSFCDAQTLGRASLVSLAFLELASPHLYGHITISGPAQLNRLFYDESPVSLAPHLDRLLSLDQTRTFTFVGSPEDTGDPVYLLDVGGVDCVFSKKRSTCTYPIRVDTLVARFHDHGEDLLLAAGDVYGDVFSLFSPTHAVLSTLNSPKPGQDIPYVVLEHVDWDRLQSLSVSNLVWSQLLSSAPFLERLPRSSLTVIVELPDLIPLLAEPTDEWTLLDHMVYELKPWANAAGRPPEMLSSERPQVKELVVKVWSEGQKEEVLKAVLKGWDMTGTLCQEERDRREAMIGFVVVD